MWERLRAHVSRAAMARSARWGVGVLVVLAALPFVLWYGFGPERFDDLSGGTVAPQPVEVPTDADGRPDWQPPSGDPSDEDYVPPVHLDVLAPDIPLTMSDTVQVTLVFSVGSRGLTSADAQRLRIANLADRGSDGLTDTIFLLIADTATQKAAILSVPRDLWLYRRGHRINATFNLHGTQAFVQDVSDVTGLPIHHVARINFAAFADLVDRIGGVPIRVDRPLADHSAALYVPGSGCWNFDGPSALAYVRSRKTLTRASSGSWVTDRSASDIGRMRRQRAVLGAAWEELRGAQLVSHLGDLMTVARQGLVVDKGLGLTELRQLAGAFEQLSAGGIEAYTIPTYSTRIGRAAVQLISHDAGRPLAARLRAWPNDPPPAPAPDPSADRETDGASSGSSGTTRPLPRTTLEVAEDCTQGTARSLPDPGPALAAIARGEDPRVADTSDDSSPAASESAPQPSEPSEPSASDGSEPPEPSEDASDPSEPAPSILPTPEEAPSASE